MPLCSLFRVPSCPLRGDTHFLWSGADRQVQLCIPLCHFNAVSVMVCISTPSVFLFHSSPRREYPLAFLKLQLNFNSLLTANIATTLKDASQFPSELPFPSKIGKPEGCLRKNRAGHCSSVGFNLHQHLCSKHGRWQSMCMSAVYFEGKTVYLIAKLCPAVNSEKE